MGWGARTPAWGRPLNRIGLPIPAGFAITTRAYDDFLAHNDLVDEINKRKMEIDPAPPNRQAGERGHPEP